MNQFQNKDQPLLKTPIIVFGTGRSGTTIISDIIFQHEDLAWHSNFQEMFPRFAGINYLRRLFDNKWWHFTGVNTQNNKSIINKICFRPIERYDFWEAVTGPRVNFSYDFLLGETATEKERKKMRAFFEKMVKYQKRKRLAFKITGPSRMEYLMSVFPDAIFVHITREPISTVRSLLGIPFWQKHGAKELCWTGAYSENELKQAEKLRDDPALFTAFQYKKLITSFNQEIKKMNPVIYTVTYEDFVNQPYKVIKNIMQFLQLSPSKLVDQYLEKVTIDNRNHKSSSAINMNEETKKRILEIASS